MFRKKIFYFVSLSLVFLLFQNFGHLNHYASRHGYIDVNNSRNMYPGPPNLDDLFRGRARFETIEEAEEVTLNFNVNGKDDDGNIIPQHIFDQKLSIHYDKTEDKYFSFTRAKFKKDNVFKIVALSSDDGLEFNQIGVLFKDHYAAPKDKWTFYDPHVALHNGEYTMTSECSNKGIGPSLCISQTKTPLDLDSWSHPKVIIKSSNTPKKSASTGVSVNFKGDTYITWTVVSNGEKRHLKKRGNPKTGTPSTYYPEDGNESTFSKGIKLHKNLNGDFIYVGKSATLGETIIGAKEDPYCKEPWDCNNTDIQDWKVEDDKVYAVYSGANYYMGIRPKSDRHIDNTWGIGIRRSNHPLGDYSESSGILIESIEHNVSGISYPVLNKINGVTYIYFAYNKHIKGKPFNYRKNTMVRSQLIRARPLPITYETRNKTYDSHNNYSEISDKIEHLYVKLLNRYPTHQELKNWTKRAKKRGYKYVVRLIALSPEHRYKWSHRDDIHKVKSMYQGVLRRHADAHGLKNFMNLASQNKSLEFFVNTFINSKEFRIKINN